MDQKLYYLNSSSASENNEGGLDLIEIKNAILRKLPLIVGCSLTITLLTLQRILNSPPIYTANFEILAEPVNILTKVTSTDDVSLQTREEITSVNLDDVQLKILKSPKLISRAIESIQDRYPELNYHEINEGLTIEIIENRNNKNNQNILMVLYQDTNRQKVLDVLDALKQTYIDYSVETRLSGVTRVISFLDQQIPKISSQVKDTENQIEKLRSQHNFIDPSIPIGQINARLNNLAQERAANAVKLDELQLMAKNFEQELTTEPTNSITADELATPRYLALKEQLHNLNIEIGRKSAIFHDNTREIESLKQEKQQITALLLEASAGIRQKLDNQIKAIENRQQKITVEMANVRSQLDRWSLIESDYEDLQNRLSQARDKLNNFNLQKDTLLMDAAQQDAPWQELTSPGEPTTNTVSNINFLILSSTFGLLLSVGAALIIDKYQRIIYTSAKVEEITQLPILAYIPYSSKRRGLSFVKKINLQKEVRQLPPQKGQLLQIPNQLVSASMEAFRSFAVNLGVFNFNTKPEDLNFDTSLKSLVITSAIPREGKSTVALNLARACASMGKKILLVDTDFRSTDCLTKNLGLESEIGLRNILNQDNSALALDYIKPLTSEENLFILTSGFNDLAIDSTKLDDPRNSLASVRMHLLMEKLKNHFDLVIYDLCAIIGFADVNLLAAKTNGIVIVSGLGKIQTMALNEALNQLRLCQAPILGIAVNQVVNKS